MTRQKTSEKVKPKVSVHQEQRKLNDIRNNEGGRGGRVVRWGDKDEVQLSKLRHAPICGNSIVMSKMNSATRHEVVSSGKNNEIAKREGENKEITVRGGGNNEMAVWEARERSEMREENTNMKILIEDNKKEMKIMIEDNNKVTEEKMNDNKSEILNQMKEDKDEFKGALDKMMEIMTGLVKKNLL